MKKKVGRPKKNIEITQNLTQDPPSVQELNISEDLVYKFSYFHNKCEKIINQIKLPIIKEVNEKMKKLLEENKEYQNYLKEKSEIENQILSSVELMEGYKPLEIDPDKKVLICKKQ
jgi:hypothetical protein